MWFSVGVFVALDGSVGLGSAAWGAVSFDGWLGHHEFVMGVGSFVHGYM